MNRAGQEAEQDADATVEGDNTENGKERSRKETDKKLSPLSTLESSFEALNVKKFDAAFVVDPLYRQTTAKFDEGGAKGLLMNNLGVYGGCRVLFDSLEVPAKCMTSKNQHDISDTIDLSFAKDCVEHMVLEVRMKDEISPTLRTIVNQFDESNRRPTDFQFHGQNTAEEMEMPFDCEMRADTEEHENCMAWSDDHDEPTVADLGSNDFVSNDADPSFPDYPQENGLFSSQDPDTDDRFGNVDSFLFLSLGFSSKQNAWAGPDHWKYRKSKDVHPPSENGSALKTRAPRSKKQKEIDLDFTVFLEKEMLDIFNPPKNPKTLLLPESRIPCNTKLPEDCHYQPEDLVKLFLLPDVKCLGRRAKRLSDESREQCNNESFPSWDNGSFCGGEPGDYEGDVHSDIEDSDTLVSQPRQVNKIEVQYDKTSKQVNVQELKITLWNHVQESANLSFEGQKETVSFRSVLANFPTECNAAATISDISPHLCFICLLHLANEKGLSIQGYPSLDDLAICIPNI
ncbi:Condensin complex subunit [Arachis hypogaea]|nr:Condensin complex subunit [Arachis hypogaea]